MDYLNAFSMEYNVDFKVDAFASGEALIDAYKECKNKYHIIFLDMEMTGLNGMKTAERIRQLPDRNVLIVFVTSYPEYMQDSFDVQASQYLIKSLSYTVFCEKMNKMLNYLSELEIHIKVISEKGEEFILYLEKIVCLETVKKSTIKSVLLVTTTDGEYEIRGKIADFEKELKDKFFISVHRSVLANMRYIKRFDMKSLEFTTGKTTTISRRKYQEIKDTFSKYMVMRYRK